MKSTMIVLAAGLVLASCSHDRPGQRPSILPQPVVAYACQDGTRLTVKMMGSTAQVRVNGGARIMLPVMGTDGTMYSNGRQTLTVRQGQVSWALGKMMPVPCMGG